MFIQIIKVTKKAMYPYTQYDCINKESSESLLFQLLGFAQSNMDYLIHIVILIFSKSSPQNDIILLICQRLILRIQPAVLFIILRIIRLITRLPFRAVFSTYYSSRKIISFFIFTELKPLMLDDPGPWCFCICIIDCCITLEIRVIQDFRFKTNRTIFKITETIIELCVYWPSVYDCFCL